MQPGPEDSYVVIDDHMAGMVTLVATPWPRLDERGGLRFAPGPGASPQTALFGPRDEQVLFVGEKDFLRALDEGRSAHRQITRELRIGDAFWVRNLEPKKPPHPPAWSDIIDVTASARLVAKAALYGAIAPRVSKEQADTLGLIAEEQASPERPAGPSASPVV